MLTISQQQIPQEAIQYVEEHKHLLTPDHSQYANQRLRTWIGAEAPLTDNRTFLPTQQAFDYNSRLWNWLHKFCNTFLQFDPEIALLHVGGANCSNQNKEQGTGGECGILLHRDAAYADYRAIGINLTGTATFGYKEVYTTQDAWTKEQNDPPPLHHVHITPGTCVIFNCKNPHFAQVGPNRWCINAWRISNKRRTEFNQFRNNTLLF